MLPGPQDAGIAVTKILDSVLHLRLKETCNILQTGPAWTRSRDLDWSFLMGSSKYSSPSLLHLKTKEDAAMDIGFSLR